MPLRVRTTRDRDEYAAAMSAIGHYFGWAATPDDAKGRVGLLPLDRMHAVFDGRDVVAGAGVFPFRLTVPGGALPCAGVTVVGVLPSHRRRGLLRRMMDAQLRDMPRAGRGRSPRSGRRRRRSTGGSATGSHPSAGPSTPTAATWPSGPSFRSAEPSGSWRTTRRSRPSP